MAVTTEPSREELKRLHVWENVDRVARDPVMTAYKRRARYHQAMWREQHGHPIGTHHVPARGDRPATARPLGSRIPLEYGIHTGANFLSSAARDAVSDRLANPQPHEMLDEVRLWSDLLSSMPMCFNLFGPLWADIDVAQQAISTLWPDALGTMRSVRFEWSPGRRDPTYLGNRSAFDAAFLLDLDNAGKGVIGVETKYHEHAAVEKPPRPDRLRRYREVTEESGVFVAGSTNRIVGTELQQLWLDHLLVLSMLQHPSGRWQWGRFVLVAPSRNSSFSTACERYRGLLVNQASFVTLALEDLLIVPALSPTLQAAITERYVW
jgi:hypothetical protein